MFDFNLYYLNSIFYLYSLNLIRKKGQHKNVAKRDAEAGECVHVCICVRLVFRDMQAHLSSGTDVYVTILKIKFIMEK